jgi:hypothetical protein
VRHLTSQYLLVAAAVIILLITGGCEQTFDPRGPYVKRLVVYGVLSSRSDSQYVRLYTTYNPNGFDPLENTSDTYVRNAKVTMTDDSTTYDLKENLIQRVDKSRYTSDLVVYLGYPCPPRPGKRYSLIITSDQGNATATVSVPAKGYVYNNTPYIFITPKTSIEDIPVSIGLSPIAQAYLVRLYINFDIGSGQNLEHRRLEIPRRIDSVGGSFVYTYQYSYPTLTRRPTTTNQHFNILYPYGAYLAIYRDLEAQYGKWFKLTSATFILTQVETNLYNYYNVANGFRDPYSVREDEPDFSNIVGGFGVFGAMVEDSIVVDLQNH